MSSVNPTYKRTNCCWNCGQRGHRRSTCQHPFRLFCSVCGKTGVFTRECHPLKNDQSLEGDASPVELEITFDPRPFIIIDSSGRRYMALIDSESARSYICQEAEDRQKGSALNHEPVSETLANNTNTVAQIRIAISSPDSSLAYIPSSSSTPSPAPSPSLAPAVARKRQRPAADVKSPTGEVWLQEDTARLQSSSTTERLAKKLRLTAEDQRSPTTGAWRSLPTVSARPSLLPALTAEPVATKLLIPETVSSAAIKTAPALDTADDLIYVEVPGCVLEVPAHISHTTRRYRADVPGGRWVLRWNRAGHLTRCRFVARTEPLKTEEDVTSF